MNIFMFGKSFFYQLQSTRLEKIIWMLWSNCQKTEIENIKARENGGKGTKLNLGGDGKFDSRGLYR